VVNNSIFVERLFSRAFIFPGNKSGRSREEALVKWEARRVGLNMKDPAKLPVGMKKRCGPFEFWLRCSAGSWSQPPVSRLVRLQNNLRQHTPH
jgi:hypothetical protein